MQSRAKSRHDRLTRRQLLKGAVGAATFVVPPLGAGATLEGKCSLDFESIHTGESLSSVYRVDGVYQSESLARIDHQLRDHRSGEVARMDPAMLDLLHELKVRTGTAAPFQVISGYRSPASNEKLRKLGRKVGRRSYHMKGMAIDIRLADVPSLELRTLALGLKRGGVGYYQTSDFVHVDVGPVRFW